jgi:hypothetical protein
MISFKLKAMLYIHVTPCLLVWLVPELVCCLCICCHEKELQGTATTLRCKLLFDVKLCTV